MFIGNGKNALAKNTQTTRSKFVFGSEFRRNSQTGETVRRPGGESLWREKDLLWRFYSLPLRRDKWKTVEQENGGELARGTRERNGGGGDGGGGKERCIMRARATGAFSRCRARIGFNIKRFYEPNKKAINRSRLDRRE